MLVFTSLECSTFSAISVRVYAGVYTYGFGSFDIDSYLRTGLRVSHSDASAEYDDLATSIAILHVEVVLYTTLNKRYLLTLDCYTPLTTPIKPPTAIQPLAPLKTLGTIMRLALSFGIESRHYPKIIDPNPQSGRASSQKRKETNGLTVHKSFHISPVEHGLWLSRHKKSTKCRHCDPRTWLSTAVEHSRGQYGLAAKIRRFHGPLPRIGVSLYKSSDWGESSRHITQPMAVFGLGSLPLGRNFGMRRRDILFPDRAYAQF